MEAAAERRSEADRGEQSLASQVHTLGGDRARLASELDEATSRSRALETANREVAQRIDQAIETIRGVLEFEEEGDAEATRTAMSQVNVTINGRQFRMACEDGQEGHLVELARELDSRITGLRAKFGEIGDTRLTVMAAITVADELAEAGLRIKRLEEELASLQDAGVAASDRTKAAQAAVAAALSAAAERIETITKKLNQTLGNGGVALG